MVAITDIPGLSKSPIEESGSSTILTGIRCTTLVKLPVALSGGSSENCAPEAGDQLSTWPCSTTPGNESTVTRADLTRYHLETVRQQYLLVTKYAGTEQLV